jgi:MFS family permease
MNLVAQQTTVANRGGHAGRAERYGKYTQAGSVGQLIGPALAGALAGGALFSAIGWNPEFANQQAPVFVMAALCSGLAAIIAIPLARHQEERRPESTTADLGAAFGATARRVLLRPGMLRAMMLSIVVVTSIDVLVAYLPVYGQQHGISVGLVGLLLSVRAAAGLVSRSMMARLLRALGRQVLLAGGLSLAGAGMLLLALAPDPWLLVVAMALFGMGTGVGQPITIAWVADQSPRSERATAIGIRLMGNRVALLTVPLLMGLIAGSAGIAITFVAVAMVLSAGAATAAVTPLGAPVERPSVGA